MTGEPGERPGCQLTEAGPSERKGEKKKMQRLARLAETFGFAPDSPLLTEAFTHRSYAVEHSLDYDNQRLEFLGDSVLEIVLTEALFRRYPAMSEGDMTKTRSALACEGTLALLARELRLGPLLRIGRGEQCAGGVDRDSTLADLFEAFTGAFFLELGFDPVRKFLLELFGSHFPDPQQLLQEPFCRVCAAAGVRTRATVVDHVVPFRGSWDLFIDAENLQSLCKYHHDQKTAQEQQNF